MSRFGVLFAAVCWTCLFTIANGACAGKATCRNLRDCAPVMSLIDAVHKPLRPSVVRYLRARQCGFADGQPRICCDVLPKTLAIFGKKMAHAPHGSEHGVKLNRAPPAIAAGNRLSIYQPEAADMLRPPRFDITVSTAPPGASAVPYLANMRREQALPNTAEVFKDAMNAYMAHYDLQRTRRSGASQSDAELDVEVR